MRHSEIDKLVEKGLGELDLSDTYLVDSRVNGNKIEVFLDSDDVVNFQKCQKLSRWLESILDDNKMFGESYTLEVSSAGVGSPLKLLRQYPKNVGRIIDIRYADNKSVRGLLTKVENNLLFVEFETKVKEGKKNKKVMVTEQIKFEDIIESKIKISFN